MTAELQQIKTEAVTNLIEKNLYQQALILAEKHWGDHHHWQHRQQFLTGIELFNGLGLRRKTMACRFRLWRADKSDPYAIFHYVRAVLDRRGPLQALQVAKTFGELNGADTTLQAQWFALLGDIYGQYRDWDTAQNYLDKAISLDPTNPRVLMGQIYLDVDQDKYEAAWERNQSLMQRHHRPAIQYGAHLKTLQHDNTAAIDILQQHLFKIESIALALQLYRLYYEEGQLEQARACVERAASLLPAGDGSMSEGFSVAAYELAFKQDDIDAACTALSDVKSPFYKRIRENLSQRKPEDQQKILEVPFVRQHHMTCAPATLTALCRYWGTAVDHLGVVEEICYDGTPNHAERRWAEGQGWIAREFKLEPEIAFALIDRGVPFTLSTVAPQSAHLQAVVGYDQRRGIYLIRDPFYPSLQEFLIEQLGEQCRSSGPRCLAILPADKAHLLEGLEFPETELYDDYFRLIESQATMLGRHQGSDAAIEFLDSRLKLNEQDKALLFMKLDWLFERSLEEQQTFCKHIIEIHPSLYEGYLRLSRILMRQHQFDAACAAAETAYEINPYNVEVSLTLGDIYFQQEQVAKAHKIYRSTLEYSVDADGVFDRLLRCHETFEEKRKELSHILDQLMQQTSYGSGILEYKDVARNLVKDEELLSFLEKAVEIRPDLWQSGYALLSHLQTMDQLERALSYANQAIAKFPLLPRLYLGRANIHFVAQNFSDAESDLKEALKQNPHWETAIIRLMDVLEAQKRYDEALVLIQKSLKFAPTNSVFHGCAADLLVGEGNTEAAIEHLEKALELNPRYDWAWDRYRGLIQKTDRPTAAKDLAKSILKERPHSVTVWCKLAEFEEDLEQRLKYLDEALEHHPKDEDINLIKCRALFGLNRIAAVKELIHDAKWNDNLPVSLLAFEAWMEAKYQRYPEAIDLMEPLTQRFPHYYDAWRLLAEWHKTLERYEQAVKYVDTCVRLYPHSPQTLTLAAEIYLEAQHNDVDVSDEAIGGFLEKAVVLAPKDQYNGLTWIDFLLEKKKWQELTRAHSIIHHNADNPYFLVRELQAAARCRDRDLAFELLPRVIESEDSNYWIYVTSYRELVDAGYAKELKQFLEQQLSNPKANSMLGWLWALYCLDFEKKANTILKYLEPLEQGSALWINAMEAVFSTGKYGGFAEVVIKKFKSALAENGRLWSLVTFHYSRIQNWKKLRRWCAPNWQRDSNEAWAVYLYSYGLRLAGKWNQAYAVNGFAASLPEDSYYDRILLWQLAQSVLLGGKALDTDRLARIRFNELSSFEQYCFALLCILDKVNREGGLDQASAEVVESFKRAKREFREISTSNVGVRFNRQIRHYLVRTYQGSMGMRLFWMLRLYLMA